MSPLHRFIFFILLGFSRAQGKFLEVSTVQSVLQCAGSYILIALCVCPHVTDGSEAPLFEPLFSSDGVTFTINERPTEGTYILP